MVDRMGVPGGSLCDMRWTALELSLAARQLRTNAILLH